MTRARDVANLIGSGNYSSTTFTATAGQTAFTISHTQGFVQVFMNGLLLDETADYTSNGSAVTLTSGAAAGDEIEVVAYNTFSVGDALPKSGGTMTGALTVGGGVTVNNGHVNIDSGLSYQWGDSHERIEQSDGKIEFFTNNGEQMTLSGSSLGIGTATPDRKFTIRNGGPVVEIDPAGASSNPIYFNYNRSTSAYLTPEYWALGHKFKSNGGSTALEIDSSGRVTIPNQPMFHAWNTTNDTFATTDQKHNFNSTRVNVGSHFDTSNYRFVAPVAGHYFFTWGGTIFNNSSGDAYVTAYLRKNGSNAGGMRTRFHSTTSSSVYAGMAGAEVQYMAANDYMEVWHYSQNGSAYSVSPEYVFTGYLIG